MGIKSTTKLLAPLLVLLTGLAVLAAAPHDWHTSPDKWKEPRIYHTSFDKSFDGRITVGKDIVPVQLTEQHWSSNKTYYFITYSPNFQKKGPWNTVISVANESGYFVQVLLTDHKNSSPTAKWINEKLLYIEVWWGRILGTTIIFDVESEKIIHKEMVHWGLIAFQQWQEGKKREDEIRKKEILTTE